MSKLWGLILAGGSGTRLWPYSREELPKQFLSFGEGHETLFLKTVRRITRITGEDFYVVCSAKWKDLVEHQLRSLCKDPSCHVITEPCSRNTAPAIALGIHHILSMENHPKGINILVAPSDHYIEDEANFVKSVEKALFPASEGFITTFGITPHTPDTGFGYIRCSADPDKYSLVEDFIEKPDHERACEFIESGNYYWNSGMFLFNTDTMTNEMKQHAPGLVDLCSRKTTELFEKFEDLESISIDKAVLEKSENVAMVPLTSDWSDVGSWDSVYSMISKDEDGNAIEGEVHLIAGRDNFISSRHRLVAGIGIRDMIVVDSPDALLIAPKGESQRVREMVQELAGKGRLEVSRAPISHRPWGRYEILMTNPRYKMKKIIIDPLKKTSLQYHHHRTENWIVVTGTAQVTIDSEERLLTEGESVFIPKCSRHRLGNPGRIPLEVIEIQKGEYLDEDDIVRVSDDYGRA